MTYINNININIINTIEKQKSNILPDHSNMVVDIILKDIAKNGPIRRILKGAKK